MERWNGLVEAGAGASAAPFPVGTRAVVGTGMTVRSEMLAGDDYEDGDDHEHDYVDVDDEDDDEEEEEGEEEQGVPACRSCRNVKKIVKRKENFKK